jgi:hypothetical protein
MLQVANKKSRQKGGLVFVNFNRDYSSGWIE